MLRQIHKSGNGWIRFFLVPDQPAPECLDALQRDNAAADTDVDLQIPMQNGDPDVAGYLQKKADAIF